MTCIYAGFEACKAVCRLTRFGQSLYTFLLLSKEKDKRRLCSQGVNDHNSLRISTRIPRTWRILLFRSTIIEIDRYDGGVLLNELGDLYFLFHNFGVQIIPFKNFFFFLSKGKKYIAKNVHKAPYSGM